jgi:taurine dioxygenase
VKGDEVMTASLTVRRLHPFGVEIVDIDLHATLKTSQMEELTELFTAHYLVVFRNQGALTREQQSEVMALFGPLTEESDEVQVVSSHQKDGVLGSSRLAFHSDYQFCRQPGLAISLHATELDDGETSTLFANGVFACSKLGVGRREELRSLSSVHVMATDLSRRNVADPFHPRWPHTTHPVVMDHPNGVPVLYVTEQQTTKINGLHPHQSEALLDELFALLYAEDNVTEHVWNTGDLVIWDNRALQHGRPDIGIRRRTLQRVSAGPGINSQWPDYQVLFGRQKAQILEGRAAT